MKVAATLARLPARYAWRQDAVSWRMTVRKLTNSGPFSRFLALKLEPVRTVRVTRFEEGGSSRAREGEGGREYSTLYVKKMQSRYPDTYMKCQPDSHRVAANAMRVAVSEATSGQRGFERALQAV